MGLCRATYLYAKNTLLSHLSVSCYDKYRVIFRAVQIGAYIRTFHPLMQFLKNDVFDDFLGENV